MEDLNSFASVHEEWINSPVYIGLLRRIHDTRRRRRLHHPQGDVKYVVLTTPEAHMFENTGLKQIPDKLAGCTLIRREELLYL